MTTISFESKIEVVDSLRQFSDDQIKNEPMLFNADCNYALTNAGPITRDFMIQLFRAMADKNIAQHWDNVIVDTRVHMLMPNWFPCIPGWHHDDVPRSRADGQPNYIDPEYRSQHALALVNGDICPTEFAIGNFELPHPEGVIYKEWHPLIQQQIDEGRAQSVFVPSNKLVFFDDRSLHQGTRAVKGGWRWFGRASWNTNRVATNEIRRQVQVYLENPMEGW